MRFLNFFTLLTLIFFTACKEDMPIVEECMEVELTNGFFQPIWYPGFYNSASNICVNPNDGDELIFAKDSNLVKYNLLSNEAEILIEDMNIRGLEWHEQDWVLFYAAENPAYIETDVWKIRSNGEDLTQLTFTKNWRSILWRNNGTEFIARKYLNFDSLFLYSDEGELMDSFSFISDGFSSWKNDDEFVYFEDNDKIITGNIETETFDTLTFTGISDIANSRAMDFISDNELVATTTEGIFKINIETGAYQTLRETCNANHYSLRTYSPENNRLFLNNIQYITEEDGRIRQDVHLVSMKIDGTDEQVHSIE